SSASGIWLGAGLAGCLDEGCCLSITGSRSLRSPSFRYPPVGDFASFMAPRPSNHATSHGPTGVRFVCSSGSLGSSQARTRGRIKDYRLVEVEDECEALARRDVHIGAHTACKGRPLKMCSNEGVRTCRLHKDDI